MRLLGIVQEQSENLLAAAEEATRVIIRLVSSVEVAHECLMRAYAVFISGVTGSRSSLWPTAGFFASLIVWSWSSCVSGRALALASWSTSCWSRYVGSWSFKEVLIKFPEEFWTHLKVYCLLPSIPYVVGACPFDKVP